MCGSGRNKPRGRQIGNMEIHDGREYRSYENEMIRRQMTMLMILKKMEVACSRLQKTFHRISTLN